MFFYCTWDSKHKCSCAFFIPKSKIVESVKKLYLPYKADSLSLSLSLSLYIYIYSMQVAQSNTYLLFIKTLCLSMAFPLRGRGTTGCKCLVGQSNTSFLHAWLGTTAFKMLLILQLSFLLFISGFLNCSRDRLPAVNFMVLIKYVVCFFII